MDKALDDPECGELVLTLVLRPAFETDVCLSEPWRTLVDNIDQLEGISSDWTVAHKGGEQEEGGIGFRVVTLSRRVPDHEGRNKNRV